MRGFTCSTSNCGGNVGPTDRTRPFLSVFLRVWQCAKCLREYLVDPREPTPARDEVPS